MADYYVKNAGDDAKDGLSDANAWKTISKVQSTLNGDQSDDTVYFNKGDEWREQYTVAGYGTSGHPFTHTSYGTGADPIINGAILIAPGTSWSSATETVGGASENSVTAAVDNIYYTPVTTTSGGVLQSFHIWIGTVQAATAMKCAIYTDDGTPDSLIANTTSEEITSFSANSWHTLNVSGGATLSATTNYHIAFWFDGANTKFSMGAGGTGTGEAKVYNSFPATASESSTFGNEGFYVTLGVQNTWKATCATQPTQVFFDTVKGTKKASIAACTSARDWYHDGATTLYCYSATDPDSAYTNPGIEASIRDHCIDAAGKEYITIDSITSKYADTTNIEINITANKSGFVISNCDISWAYLHGIHLQAYSGATMSGVDVHDNTIHYNGDTVADAGVGLYVQPGGGGGFDDPQIYDNTTHHNVEEGLILQGSTNGDMYGNYCHDDGQGATGYGSIIVSGASDSVIVTRNLCQDNSAENIWIGGSTGVGSHEISYNICSGAGTNTAGITVNDSNPNTKLYNNTIYDCPYGITLGHTAQVTGILIKNNIMATIGAGNNIETYNSSTFTSDYNCFDSGNGYDINGSYYATLALYQSGETQDANSIASADPLFIDAANDKFSLQSTSPCIDAGVDVSLTTDYAGSTVPAPSGGSFDIGAFEYVKMAPSVATVTASTPSVTPTVQYNSAVSTGGAMGMGISMGM